jgi:hypothetical protein
MKNIGPRLRGIIFRKETLGIILGAIGGYIYYRTVGCTTGACPLQSSPWTMILWGGLLGYLVAGLFQKSKKKEKEAPETKN